MFSDKAKELAHKIHHLSIKIDQDSRLGKQDFHPDMLETYQELQAEAHVLADEVIFAGRTLNSEPCNSEEGNQVLLHASSGPLGIPDTFCCNFLRQNISETCRGKDKHSTNTEQCPDQVICYSAKFREYSISPIAAAPNYSIHFCPSCGHKFPGSLRDKWFEIVEVLQEVQQRHGVVDPDEIPEKFQSDLWWKEAGL